MLQDGGITSPKLLLQERGLSRMLSDGNWLPDPLSTLGVSSFHTLPEPCSGLSTDSNCSTYKLLSFSKPLMRASGGFILVLRK